MEGARYPDGVMLKSAERRMKAEPEELISVKELQETRRRSARELGIVRDIQGLQEHQQRWNQSLTDECEVRGREMQLFKSRLERLEATGSPSTQIWTALKEMSRELWKLKEQVEQVEVFDASKIELLSAPAGAAQRPESASAAAGSDVKQMRSIRGKVTQQQRLISSGATEESYQQAMQAIQELRERNLALREKNAELVEEMLVDDGLISYPNAEGRRPGAREDCDLPYIVSLHGTSWWRKRQSPVFLAHAGATRGAAGATASHGLCVFYNPIDIKWPGRDEFGGYVCHGSYDSIKYEKLKDPDRPDATVVIVGHGGFTIENVRTCVERKCKKVYVVCRHRHLAGPKMVSWMVSVKARRCMGCLERPRRPHLSTRPFRNANADRSSAILTQTTTFGVTDIYFLACYYKVCEVINGEVEKLAQGKVVLKDGKEIDCNVVMTPGKCLGSTGATDFDDIIGFKFYQGWWVNGDPLLPVVAPAKGVQAKNFGGFSLAPGYAGQIITNRYFIDFPQKFLGVRDWLPKTTRDEHYECNYIYKGSHVLATTVILQGQFPDLTAEMGEADKLKAEKHMKAHPLEKHLAECLAEWKMYIKMLKDHGQIPADAEEVEYPYTKENIEEISERAKKFLMEDFSHMGGVREDDGQDVQEGRQSVINNFGSLYPGARCERWWRRGERVSSFYRISPIAVPIAARRLRALEASLTSKDEEEFRCTSCSKRVDALKAPSLEVRKGAVAIEEIRAGCVCGWIEAS
eukprot:g18797.t1